MDQDLAYSRCCSNTRTREGPLLLPNLRPCHYSSWNDLGIHTSDFDPHTATYMSPLILLLHSFAHQPQRVINCILLTQRGHRGRSRMKLHGEATLQVNVLEGGCLGNTCQLQPLLGRQESGYSPFCHEAEEQLISET